MEYKNSYQNEQNVLLQTILKSFINKNSFPLQLFITSECNQNCSYCYLVKNQNELYPKNIRNKEQILINLDLLLNYYYEKKYVFPRVDIFTGEIWGQNFSFDILKCIYKYLQKGLIINSIVIPSNCSFILNEVLTKQIQKYIDLFSNYNCKIIFSISIDGPIDYFTRPFKSQSKLKTQQVKNTKYYNNLFLFAKKNNFAFHPMVAAESIESWKKNYLWWYEQINKYNYIENIYSHTMFLEVRNNYWTDEKIIKYLDFLNFMIETDISKYWSQQEDITPLYQIMSFSDYIDSEILNNVHSQHHMHSYIPYSINKNDSLRPSCSLTRNITVRLGDLAICPCHRTAYDKFLYGYYQVENNKIIGITAKNVNLAFRFLKQNNFINPKCNSCDFLKYCLYGCYGAQYESTGDILYPCETVCNLEKAKTIFVYLKGQEIKERFSSKINNQYLLDDQQGINKMEQILNSKEGKKWSQIYYAMK